MNFLLDTLVVTLVIFCLILAFRLVRSRLLHRHRSPLIHPVLMPIEHAPENHREIKLTYELPFDNHVSISLLDASENLIRLMLDKDQKAGAYFIKQELPAESNEFFLLFVTPDSKVLKRIKI